MGSVAVLVDEQIGLGEADAAGRRKGTMSDPVERIDFREGFGLRRCAPHDLQGKWGTTEADIDRWRAELLGLYRGEVIILHHSARESQAGCCRADLIRGGDVRLRRLRGNQIGQFQSAAERRRVSLSTFCRSVRRPTSASVSFW